MSGRLIGSLPVVENGRVIGIVTATDVLEELGRGSAGCCKPAPEHAARASKRAIRPACQRA
jgi:hypothetical protein